MSHYQWLDVHIEINSYLTDNIECHVILPILIGGGLPNYHSAYFNHNLAYFYHYHIAKVAKIMSHHYP